MDAAEDKTENGLYIDEEYLKRLIPILYDEKANLKTGDVGLIHEYEHPAIKRKRRTTRRQSFTTKRIEHKSSKDVMPDQSLGDVIGEGDSDVNTEAGVDPDRILKQDSADFDGIAYNKNKCYQVDGDRVFGIKQFLRDGDSDLCVSALCVEIIQFNKAVLETVNPTLILRFIQRGGSEREIHLSDLGKEVEKIPAFMYHERQSGSSNILFGLEDASKTPQRNGPRDLIKSPLRGIDFYAGAGLMGSGFQAVSFNIVVSVEKNEDAIKSNGRIHAATVSKVSDMSSNRCKEILSNGGKIAFHDTVEVFLQRCAIDPSFKKALGPIDFVITCSPCQGFSKQNIFKEGDVVQNNLESLRILKAAELLQPKVFVFENVLGMWESKHIKGYLQKMVNGLTFKFGYNVKVAKLCAADFGDPQLRPRLFLIASLSDIGIPVTPKPTHCQPYLCNGVPGGLFPYVTAKDALIMEEDKHPEREKPINDDGKPRDPNRPTTTVLASKSSAHYNMNLNRFYSLRENAILMGQSPDFVDKLVGNEKSKQRQIGNGVPMGMAKAIARSCLEVLKWNWEGVEHFREGSRIEESDQETTTFTQMPDEDAEGEADINESNYGMFDEDIKCEAYGNERNHGISREDVKGEVDVNQNNFEISEENVKDEADDDERNHGMSDEYVNSEADVNESNYGMPDEGVKGEADENESYHGISDEDVKSEADVNESKYGMSDEYVKDEADVNGSNHGMPDKDVKGEADVYESNHRISDECVTGEADAYESSHGISDKDVKGEAYV